MSYIKKILVSLGIFIFVVSFMEARPLERSCEIVKVKHFDKSAKKTPYVLKMPLKIKVLPDAESVYFPTGVGSETFYYEGVYKLRGEDYRKFRSKLNGLLFVNIKNPTKVIVIVGEKSDRALLITRCYVSKSDKEDEND